MPHSTDDITLANRHYTTLILRLTLDRHGHLIQGELLDTTYASPKHFIRAAGLHQAVTAWLRQQREAGRNQEP